MILTSGASHCLVFIQPSTNYSATQTGFIIISSQPVPIIKHAGRV